MGKKNLLKKPVWEATANVLTGVALRGIGRQRFLTEAAAYASGVHSVSVAHGYGEFRLLNSRISS
jgi:hypothetical protein